MNSPSRVDVAAVTDQAPLSRLQIQVALVLFCITLLDGFDTQVIAFVAPAIASDWGLPMARFGPIFAAGLLGSVIGAVVFGMVADRIGRKIVTLCALAEFALLTLACAFARNYEVLLALRFLAGLGLGAVLPNVFALASEYAAARYRVTMVTFTLWGFPIGGVIGGSATAALMRDHGWEIGFYIGGIVPLLLLPLFAFWLPESIRFLTLRGDASERVARILSRVANGLRFQATDIFILTERRIEKVGVPALFQKELALGTWLLCAALFLSLLLTYLLINWIPSVLRGAGVELRIAVMGTVMLNVAGILGSLVFSRLVNRFDPLVTMTSGYLIGSAAVVAIGAVPPTPTTLMTAIFLAGFFIIGAQLSLTAYIADFYPTQIRATGTGFSQGVGRAGSLIGPLLGGVLLSQALSQDALFRFIAVPAFVAAVCLLVLRFRQRPSAALAPPNPASSR